MKKVLFSVMGIALIVLLLAALNGVVLASSEKSMPSVILDERVGNDLTRIVRERSAGVKEETPAVVNVVQDESAEQAVELPVAVELPSQELEDDGPEGEHAEGGCGGYADPEKWAIKIDAAAELLGLTPEEIVAQVQAGKRLYEIAAEQGADMAAFRDTVHAAIGGCGCGSH